MVLADIDWAALSRPQHEAVFAALVNVHDDVLSRVRVGEGRDNTTLFTLASDLNTAMGAGNDDLARRELAFIGGDVHALR